VGCGLPADVEAILDSDARRCASVHFFSDTRAAPDDVAGWQPARLEPSKPADKRTSSKGLDAIFAQAYPLPGRRERRRDPHLRRGAGLAMGASTGPNVPRTLEGAQAARGRRRTRGIGHAASWTQDEANEAAIWNATAGGWSRASPRRSAGRFRATDAGSPR
jgi:hypothetical protein